MGFSQGTVETQDLQGTTDHFNGTVGTSPVSIPTVGTTYIQEVLIDCPASNQPSKNLLVSFDAGATFKTLVPGANLAWTLKGNRTQIQIKGSSASVAYEIILNREP